MSAVFILFKFPKPLLVFINFSHQMNYTDIKGRLQIQNLHEDMYNNGRTRENTKRIQRNRLPNLALCYVLPGKRNIGCSRKTWIIHMLCVGKYIYIYSIYVYIYIYIHTHTYIIYIFGMRIKGTGSISLKILIQEAEEN
jgi:hypothetical protein